MASNIHYGWTLFVNPISAKTGWPLVAIQVAFTVLIVSQTWLIAIQGYLGDRFGPKAGGDVRRRPPRLRMDSQRHRDIASASLRCGRTWRDRRRRRGVGGHRQH